MRNLIAILTFLSVSSLAAQPLTVGTQLPDPNRTTTNLTSTLAPVSYVNLADRASAAGTVNRASVYWSKACPGAFKVVFLNNPVATGTAFVSTLSSFNVVATRGPFDAIAGQNDVTLTPPVTVSSGDLIGVVQLQPSNTCGSVETMLYGDHLGFSLITISDISTAGALGTAANSSNFEPGLRISAVAYASDPLLVRILPAAGAVQGANSFFRTAVQIHNHSSALATGSFVFHPQGQSASASDPSLPFTLAANQVLSYPDLITTMGTSGLGSLDIVTAGGAAPIVTARVFSDGGVAGTSGFSEEGLSPSDAIEVNRTSILFTPDDLTNFRMNIGVRTLDAGANISIRLYDADGNLKQSRSATYPANYFEQVPVSTFTGASTVPAGGRIDVFVSPGKAFVYSSVIDNRTSDSTYRLAEIK